MAKVKSAEAASAKWQRRAGNAGPEYEEGVRNPRADWATETKAAAPSYSAGVTKAVQEKRYERGVSKAGTAKWQKNAVEKGPTRYAEGVRLSGDAYTTGTAPYLAVLSGLQLPPRGPKGDPKNIDRVRAVSEALHAKKNALRGTA